MCHQCRIQSCQFRNADARTISRVLRLVKTSFTIKVTESQTQEPLSVFITPVKPLAKIVEVLMNSHFQKVKLIAAFVVTASLILFAGSLALPEKVSAQASKVDACKCSAPATVIADLQVVNCQCGPLSCAVLLVRNGPEKFQCVK